MTHYVMSELAGRDLPTLTFDPRVDTFDFDNMLPGSVPYFSAYAGSLYLSIDTDKGYFFVQFDGLAVRDLLSPAFHWSEPIPLAATSPANGFSHEVQVSIPSWTNQTYGSPAREPLASDAPDANGSSSGGSLSWDGRWAVFTSQASNLVAGDGNGHADVFMHDHRTGHTECLSVSASGVQADADCSGAVVAADATAAAFQSRATNLVDGQQHAGQQVYLKLLDGGAVELVSAAANGSQGDADSRDASLSGDAQVVAFTSDALNLVSGDTNGQADVFVRLRDSGTLLNLSAGGDGASGHAQVAYDGHSVVFESDAGNLVAGDLNGQRDIFLRDLLSDRLVLVSQSLDGQGANGASHDASVSADGRYVVFTSEADNLVAGDTNGVADVFRRDLQTGETVRVSVAADGTQADGVSRSHLSISGDGRFVAFESAATGLVAGDGNGTTDVFIKDLDSGRIARVSEAAGSQAVLSADGAWVLLQDAASGQTLSGTNPIDAHLLIGANVRDNFHVNSPYDELRSGDTSQDQWDLLYTSGDFTLPDAFHWVILEGAADADLTGNATGNYLHGNDGANVIDGRAGADTMNGFLGSDTYYVDDPGDIVTDDNGNDTFSHDVVWASASANVYGVEEVHLLGTDNLAITDRHYFGQGSRGALLEGNAGDNVIRVTGYDLADDTLLGGDGDDVLLGGIGNNRLVGGNGDDTYLLMDGNDVVVELAGGGRDTLVSRHDRTLTDLEERLLLTAFGGANEAQRHATGNGGDNLLMGGATDDTLDGAGGTDVVSYNGAAWWMQQGVVVNLATGTASGGMGHDTLIDIEGVLGSRRDDLLIGDDGRNLLFGGAGADTMTGGGGADRFELRGLDAADLVTDFDATLDHLLVSMKGLQVGNADTVIDHATEIAGPGGFGTDAELVVATAAVAGTLDAASAAAAVGSAHSAYGIGDERVFIVGNGSQVGVWLFHAADANAEVSAAELTLMGLLQTPQTVLADDIRWAI